MAATGKETGEGVSRCGGAWAIGQRRAAVSSTHTRSQHLLVHVRNHGFIRERSGWRLAPAYDLNPNPARRTHALKLDDASDVPDVETVLGTAELYRLTRKAARRVLDDIHAVTREWKKRAKAARITAAETAAVEEAFALSV